MRSNYKKILGYSLLLVSLLDALIFSFKPDIILVEGNPLDTGYMISKTLFIITTLLILTIIGVQLINKK